MKLHTLRLRAINQLWSINYIKTSSTQLRFKVLVGEKPILNLFGATEDVHKVTILLHKWLKRQGEIHLIPWLERLSKTHNLPFNKVTIRGQRTIWGSCNSNKNISLNYKLLFLESYLAEHVILHELCHTKHLNHSKRFWNLLTTIDPNTRLHDKQILTAGKVLDAVIMQGG